jgi:hypothetical protein
MLSTLVCSLVLGCMVHKMGHKTEQMVHKMEHMERHSPRHILARLRRTLVHLRHILVRMVRKKIRNYSTHMDRRKNRTSCSSSLS